jgi:hypothetical protein
MIKYCEDGNESAGSTKYEELADQLSNHRFSRNLFHAVSKLYYNVSIFAFDAASLHQQLFHCTALTDWFV